MRFLSLLLACGALANDYVEFSRHTSIPSEWSLTKRVPDPSSQIRMSIHLKQADVDKFEKHVLDISTPGNPLYGKHMTQDEVSDMIKPAPETVDAVVKWLCACGMKHRHVVKNDWIYVNATLAEAEDMLKTKYETYLHKDGVSTRVRTTTYSLPRHLHEHINMVSPTNALGQLKPMHSHILPAENPVLTQLDSRLKSRQVGNNLQSLCQYPVTPQCLKALYNIPDNEPQPDNNVLGIAGFLGQWVQNDDLLMFQQKLAPNTVNQGYIFQGVNGGQNWQRDDPNRPLNQSVSYEEANLDIQYAMALGAPTKLVYYQTGGEPPLNENYKLSPGTNNTNEPYMQYLDYLLGLQNLPATITTSYGEDEQTVPKEYAISVCNKFAQLGARGVSVIFSSGDFGPGDDCTDLATKRNQLQATFPASCPWVTGVGATFEVPERAVPFSGGGFSMYWPAPAYQRTAIANWKRVAGAVNRGLYPSNGRGVPDVSAQGYHYNVVVDQTFRPISGTSAASPAFAAIIARINGALMLSGKPRLGFLNPWIYSGGQSGFNDITSGASRGCTQNSIGPVSWNAVQGWDPVTGVGTPDYTRLRGLAMSASTGQGLEELNAAAKQPEQTQQISSDPPVQFGGSGAQAPSGPSASALPDSPDAASSGPQTIAPMVPQGGFTAPQQPGSGLLGSMTPGAGNFDAPQRFNFNPFAGQGSNTGFNANTGFGAGAASAPGGQASWGFNPQSAPTSTGGVASGFSNPFNTMQSWQQMYMQRMQQLGSGGGFGFF